jgi:hypothetical protein
MQGCGSGYRHARAWYGWVHFSLGGREEGTGASTAPNLRLVRSNTKVGRLVAESGSGKEKQGPDPRIWAGRDHTCAVCAHTVLVSGFEIWA